MGFKKLPRKTVLMDDRGRITIPDYMREALKIDIPKGGSFPIEVEVVPNLENSKGLTLRKLY